MKYEDIKKIREEYSEKYPDAKQINLIREGNEALIIVEEADGTWKFKSFKNIKD